MKKYLFSPAVVSMIIFSVNCNNTRRPDNPISGKWKSLWAGSHNQNIDLNLSFETNNTFHLTASGGGQTQPVKIYGIYRVNLDTFFVLDKIDEPLQQCSYTDTGKYIFTKRTDTLFFKVIKDLCEKRKLTLEMGLLKAGQDSD